MRLVLSDSVGGDYRELKELVQQLSVFPVWLQNAAREATFP